jgi:hypothetical protein
MCIILVQRISFIPILQRISRFLFVSIALFVGDTESVCVCVCFSWITASMVSQMQEVVVKFMERVKLKTNVPRETDS